MLTLLTSPTTQEALSRAQMLTVVEHSDAEALEQLLASQTAVDAQRDVLVQQQRAYHRVLNEREQVLRQLNQLQATYERKVGRCNDRLTVLQRQEEIADDDEERLTAALAEGSPAVIPPSASASGWTWPARGPLTSGFGQRWGRLHAGIDVSASTGAPIYAANGGVVSYAGVMGGSGNIIVIDHGGSMTTRYAHQSQLAASVGQIVRPGDQIGYIGSTGNVTGPHLHFEVRINDQPQDPIGYLP